MAKKILGVYSTTHDMNNSIAVYELSGHPSRNVIIFAKDSIDVNAHHDIVYLNAVPSDEEQGMINKFKSTFSKQEPLHFDTVEQLIAFGLSKEDAVHALTSVQDNQIVVIVDDELRMGHA